jgi:hypothetical protein
LANARHVAVDEGEFAGNTEAAAVPSSVHLTRAPGFAISLPRPWARRREQRVPLVGLVHCD